MKIALVVPGGVDRSGVYRVIPALLWIIERLARRHELHVFALRQHPRPDRYPLLGATVHSVGAPLTLVRAMGRLLAEHRNRPFDIVHAFWANLPGAVAVAAGKMLRRPVVLHVAGGELVGLSDIAYGGRLAWRSRVVVPHMLRGASRVTAASSPIRDEVASFGVSSVRLPLGVALDRWPVSAPRRRSGPARLIHVGSLNPVKDQSTLVRATEQLAAAKVPFHVDVVGVDTLDGAVQSEVAACGLEACFTFHGFVPHHDIRPLMERAHLMLVTSRHEAGPVAALEAAVAGVPTVGTAVGQLCDWAPEAAVTVPVGDYRELAGQTQRLLADDTRRLAIASAAQALAVAEDADWTVGTIEDIYETVKGPVR